MYYLKPCSHSSGFHVSGKVELWVALTWEKFSLHNPVYITVFCSGLGLNGDLGKHGTIGRANWTRAHPQNMWSQPSAHHTGLTGHHRAQPRSPHISHSYEDLSQVFSIELYAVGCIPDTLISWKLQWGRVQPLRAEGDLKFNLRTCPIFIYASLHKLIKPPWPPSSQ